MKLYFATKMFILGDKTKKEENANQFICTLLEMNQIALKISNWSTKIFVFMLIILVFNAMALTAK